MKKSYFIFGTLSCDAYNDNNTNGVIAGLFRGCSLYVYDNSSDPKELLKEYGEHTEFIEITEDMYDDLMDYYRHELVGEWTASDLFNWLQNMHIIADDEEVEDWYDSRGDMVDMVRDNLEKFHEGN